MKRARSISPEAQRSNGSSSHSSKKRSDERSSKATIKEELHDVKPEFSTEEEEIEAARVARIASRAEAKALARAAAANGAAAGNGHANGTSSNGHARAGEPPSLEDLLAAKRAEEESKRDFAVGKGKVAFKTKQQREAEAMARLAEKRGGSSSDAAAAAATSSSSSSSGAMRDRGDSRHRGAQDSSSRYSDRDADKADREERIAQRERVSPHSTVLSRFLLYIHDHAFHCVPQCNSGTIMIVNASYKLI
jgi:hypothetical protein